MILYFESATEDARASVMQEEQEALRTTIKYADASPSLHTDTKDPAEAEMVRSILHVGIRQHF